MLRVVVVRSRTGRVRERANSKPKPNANPSAIRKVIIFCRYCKVVLTLDFEVLIELVADQPPYQSHRQSNDDHAEEQE
jgi:hypothetical protein